MDLSKFQKKVKKGDGGFGEVFVIEEIETKNKYAAKISLRTINPKSIDDMLYLSREINIIASIDHPLILKFIGYNLRSFSNELRPVIVTEYIKDGSLQKLIEDERQALAPIEWNDNNKFLVIFGIATGMSFLHLNNIIHRDLKPSNILINISDDIFYPKIADFGLSKKVHQNSNSFQSEFEVKGTYYYLAPEIFKDKKYMKSSDVYAFGIIVYEIITNQMPYKESKSNQMLLISEIVNGRRPLFEDPIAPCYRNLIEKCWSQDPDKRPTFEDIVLDLKNNSEFSQFYDKNSFLDFIELIEEYPIKYESNKQVIKIEDYVNLLELKLREINKIELNDFTILKKEGDGPNAVIQKGRDQFIFKQFLPHEKEDENSYVERIQIIFNDKSKESIFLAKGISFTNVDGEYFNYPFIIQEYPEHGTLKDLIENSKDNQENISNTKKMIIIYGIARKMLKLHENRISYKNLTATNILLNKDYHPFLRCFQDEASNDILIEKLKSENSEEELQSLRSFGKIMYYILVGDFNLTFSKIDSIPSFFSYLLKSLFDKDTNRILTFSDVIKLFDLGIIFPSILFDQKETENYFQYVKLFVEPIKFSIENIQENSQIPQKNPYIKSIITTFLSDYNKYDDFQSISQKTENEEGNEKAEIVHDHFLVFYKLNKIDHTAEIIESPNAKGEIIIPSSINYNNDNYTVKQICDNAFHKSSIFSLSFDANSKVQRIGDFAFENSKLQKLFLPASLIELGKYWCGVAPDLSQIKVDKNNNFFVKAGEVLFYQNKNPKFSPTEILFVPRNWPGFFNIPKNITRIGSFAFYNCNKIQKVTYDTQIIDLGDYCFCGATKLESVNFKCEELFIGKFCFVSCISLSSIFLENVNNAQIGMNSFEECNSLTSFSLNSTSNITIEGYSFNGAMNLRNVYLSCNESLIIGRFCFCKCSSLESVSFGNSSYLKIGKKCFEGCEKLEKLNLSNVKTIELDELCFSGMNNFKDFYFQSDTILFNGHLFTENQNITSISITNNQDLTIPNTAFDNCKNLKCIKFSTKSTLTISKDSFNQLPFLANIVLNGNKIIIEDNCFNECVNTKVNANSYFATQIINIQSHSFVEIGNNCFNKMINLELIEVVGAFVKIGNYCFNQCLSLSTVNILRASEILINKHCFNECYKISTITFTDVSFVEIKSGSFIGCENITKITITPSKYANATKCFENIEQIENGNNYSTFITQKNKQSDKFLIDCSNQKIISNEFQKSFFKRMIQLNCMNSYSGLLPLIGFGFMTINSVCIPSIFRKNLPYHSLGPYIRKEIQYSLSGPQKYIILLGITHGIKSLHSLNIFIPYLAPDNVLLDENLYPYIFDYRIYFEPNNINKTFKEDIYSYLLIAYELITGKAVYQNNFENYIQYYLDLIEIPRIKELFRRIWLFGLAFIPPIDDIYEEIKNEQYKKLFLSKDQDISEYLDFLEKSDYINKDEDKQNEETQKIAIKTKDGIVLKLYKNNRTAEIVSSEQAESNIFIPRYCEFRSIKYEITRIHKSALSSSLIKSLSFSLNSKIERIDDFAFCNSHIRSLYIPSSLVEIGKLWIGGAEYLSQFEVDSNSTHFIKENDILYYINQSQNQKPTKELLFIPRKQFGHIQIDPKITHIRSFAFYKCQIQSVFSNSSSVEVDSHSFDQCRYLESISLQSTSHCSISEQCFYGLDILKSLGIICNDLILSKNWIKYCSSLDVIIFKITNDFIIDNQTFNEIKTISGISVASKSSLTISQGSFVGLQKLCSISLKGKQLHFNYSWLYNCPNLKTIVVESFEKFTIAPGSFDKFDSLDTIQFISSSSLSLMEKVFDFSNVYNNSNKFKLKSVDLIANDIVIENSCFKSLKELQKVQISCHNLIIKSNCFNNCLLLKSISFENIESITLNSCIFTGCPYLRDIVIQSSSVIDIKNFCFNKSSNLQTITLKSSVVNIGNNCFEDCYNLNCILFEGTQNLKIGSHAFNGCKSLSLINIQISSDLTICNNCFSGASNLQHVTICCDGLTLGKFIFSNCLCLKEVTIRNKKDYTIDKEAFHDIMHKFNLKIQKF